MARHRKAPDSSSPSQNSSAEEIRALAYQLYCENGCQDGRAMEDWLEAERRLAGGEHPSLRRAA
jgi:hypothetical protein